MQRGSAILLAKSKQVFELPLRSQPPFALLLDYAVDEHGAVIVEVNGKRVVTAPFRRQAATTTPGGSKSHSH